MNALILVDIQNDFLPGGALAVPNGDQVIPVANDLAARSAVVVATQDWHPAGHGSFASAHPGHVAGDVIQLNGLEQMLWPDHCVQDTPGAALAPGLLARPIHDVFTKGTDPGVDSYSAFFDNGRRPANDLAAFLRERGIECVHILGLATDYCVKFTALDAVDLGFRTVVIEDGCRGIDAKAGDVAKAMAELKSAGVEISQSHELRAAYAR